MSRKGVQRLALALAVALALGTGLPAAGVPAVEAGWLATAGERLAAWWTALWGAEPPAAVRAWAAGETLPDIDPNGAAPNPDPDGLSFVDGDEPPNGGETWPDIDPDG